MSYILDALKKAESERKLGSIPNVYTPAPNVTAMSDEHNRRKWLPWILTGAALAALLTCLAWLQPWSQSGRPMASTTPAISAAPVLAPAIAPTPAVAPIIAPTPVSQPMVSQAKPMPVTVAEVAKKSKPVAVPAVAPAPLLPAQSAPATEEAKAPGKEAVAAETASDDESVGTIRNLPHALQAEVPPIVVNGYIYAKNPTDRSVLINQKLLHEGDQIAPELVLEKMLPKGAILNYKGYRYRVAF